MATSVARKQEHISVMWKTVSEACNLACDYCYYSTCGGKPGKQIEKIADHVLEKFIKEYMSLTNGIASFAWQGGEPLLAGYEFFTKVVELQQKYAPKNTMISNALQTNGTLITERWAKFFKQYHFLIGVSIDGPEAIHDSRRVDAVQQGSFERVMKGINHLRKQQVEFNILTVIHKDNVHRVKELFDFYKEQQIVYIQFIPCMSFQSQQIDQPGSYEITPEEYGNFLCEAFDHWYNDGQPVHSERMFDHLLSVYAHREGGLCVQSKSCPKTIILEQNGDAYPCDFFIHDDWKIGNVGEDALVDILNDPLYATFLQQKPTLPEACQTCPWLSLCYGGCPRNRNWDQASGNNTTDYFCTSYQQLFGYAHERLQKLGDGVRQQLYQQGIRHYYKGKAPGRNDLCACGSGRKYKVCCLPVE
ncbi:anaerobic sulfatase maturase [Paenibacillus yanchengensis]|uniref:Anaerobic sulfatase maturase n=1 Tax=Paenibacillus yanchengensis TaxID=2035833 RepID=A0ABW4YQL1_9BACL